MTDRVKNLLIILLISLLVLFVFVVNKAYAIQYERNEKVFKNLNTIKNYDKNRDKVEFSEKEKLSSNFITEADIGIEGQNYVTGEVVVKFKESKIDLDKSSGKQSSRLFADSKNLEKIGDIENTNAVVLKTKGSESVKQAMKRLKEDSDVEYVEPNFIRYSNDINTNDEYKDLMWAIENIGQNVNGVTGISDADIDGLEAWGVTEGGSEVVVAVIDSGVAYEHPDLEDNMWDGENCKDDAGIFLGGCNHGYDYAEDDKTPLPYDSSHGTHVSGTIAALKNNGKGVIGVAPNVKIMAIRFGFDTVSEVRAINFAINNDVKIINASYGGPSFSQAEHDAIEAFKNAGGLFINSAGNDTSDNDSVAKYPANYDLDNILVVAATDQSDALASFSNFGLTQVDISAPGVNIASALNNSYEFNDNFESVFTPDVPSYWDAQGINWGTYDLGGSWGNVMYGDAFNMPYATSTGMSLFKTANSLDLSDAQKAEFGFWAACDTEYTNSLDDWQDYMELGVVNNNTSTFTSLMKFDEYYIDYVNEENPLSDSNSAVAHFSGIEIPQAYLVDNLDVWLIWRADDDNDTGSSGDGCFIDDFKLVKHGTGADETYGYKDGTSMAAPHVAGLAALLWSYDYNLSYSQVRDIIENTGDSIESLGDKTSTGKRINAYNALFSVASILNTSVGLVGLDSTSPYYVNSSTPRITVNGDAGMLCRWGESDLTYSSLINECSIEGSVANCDLVDQGIDGIKNISISCRNQNNIDQTVDNNLDIEFVLDRTSPIVSDVNVVPSPAAAGEVNVQIQFSDIVGMDYVVNPTVQVTGLSASPYTLDKISYASSTWDGAFILNNDTEEAIGTIKILGAKDLVGNMMDVVADAGIFWVDTLPPVALLNGVPDAVTSTTSINIQVSGNDVVSYQYNLDGIGYGDEISTTTSIVVENLTSNEHSVLVIGKDGVGNWQSTSTPTTYLWDVDLQIPVLSGLLSDSTPVKSKTWTWSSDDLNASYRYVIDQAASTTPSGEFSSILTATQPSGDGVYYLHVQAIDEQDNLSEVVHVSAVLDNTAPGVVLTSTPSSITNSQITSMIVGGSNVTHYKYKLDNGSYGDEYSVADYLILTSLSEGSHVLSVIGRDSAGNWQDQDGSTDFSWIVQLSGPQVTSVFVSPASVTSGQVDLVIDFASSEVEVSTTTSPVVQVIGLTTTPYNVSQVSFFDGVWQGQFTLNDDNEEQEAMVSVSGAQDVLGNVMITNSNAASFAVDTKEPVARLIPPVATTTNALKLIFNEPLNLNTLAIENASDLVLNIENDVMGSSSVIDIEQISDAISWDNSLVGSPIASIPISDTLFSYNQVVSLNFKEGALMDVAGNFIDSSLNHQAIVLSGGQMSALPLITLNNNQKQAVLVSGQSSVINIPEDVENPTISVGDLVVNSGTSSIATLASTSLSVVTSISATPVAISIPSNTQITAPAGWNGIINAPRPEDNSSVTPVADSGKNVSAISVLEVGAGDTQLLFNKAVRLLIPSAGNKYMGYQRGSVFTTITDICSADSQVVGDALPAGGDCKVTIADDMIIWTKHFTKFVAYDQVDVSVSSGGSGGGSSNRSFSASSASVPEATYQVYQPLENTLTTSEHKAPVNVVVDLPGIPEVDKNGNITLEQMLDDAQVINNNLVSLVVSKMGYGVDQEEENYINKTVVTRIVGEEKIDLEARLKIIRFVTYGTKSTKELGAGERAGVVNSFKSAFLRFPLNEEDWNDVIKIANGRWPEARSNEAENRAKLEFEKIYKRSPLMRDPFDNAAVTIITYGLRPANRNLESERAALATFKLIYLHIPTSAQDWDIIRAVAYSGARRAAPR